MFGCGKHQNCSQKGTALYLLEWHDEEFLVVPPEMNQEIGFGTRSLAKANP